MGRVLLHRRELRLLEFQLLLVASTRRGGARGACVRVDPRWGWEGLLSQVKVEREENPSESEKSQESTQEGRLSKRNNRERT